MRRWTGAWPSGVIFGVAVVLLGAAPTELPEYPEAQTVARTIIEETRGLLMREMHDKGPVGALTACSTVALALAQKHEHQGWRVRRVSTKVRNPADTPDAYETEVLKQFESLKAQGALTPETEHVAVVDEQGKSSLRYLKPMTIAAPLCLTCHGQPDEIAPEVRAKLQTLYPGDQATGYRLNDLRGAVSVAIPLPGASR